MVFLKSCALRVRSVCATLPASINMRRSSWSWDEWHWSACGRKHWVPIILAGTMANICGCARHCAGRFLLHHPFRSHSPLGRRGCQLWSSVLCPLLIRSRCRVGQAARLWVPWVVPGFGASLCACPDQELPECLLRFLTSQLLLNALWLDDSHNFLEIILHKVTWTLMS